MPRRFFIVKALLGHCMVAFIGCKPIVKTHSLLILSGRKRIRSEPSALNELNNEHNDGNHEQKMDQSAAKMSDKAQKPEHD
jgi:hypothetical protein